MGYPDEITELLEWRMHGSHDQITYTEFGPYMIDRSFGGVTGAWLPDADQQCKIKVVVPGGEKEAKGFCQSDLDGRRALRLVRRGR